MLGNAGQSYGFGRWGGGAPEPVLAAADLPLLLRRSPPPRPETGGDGLNGYMRHTMLTIYAAAEPDCYLYSYAAPRAS